MNRKTEVLLILLLPLFGCAVGPTTGKDCTPPAPSAHSAAEVIVYRPHVLQGSAVPYRIAIDDCIVGELEDRSLINYKVVAGKHRIQTKDAEIAVDLRTGTTSHIRFWLANTGKFLFYFHGPHYEHVAKFALVDKATAEKEMKDLRKPGE